MTPDRVFRAAERSPRNSHAIACTCLFIASCPTLTRTRPRTAMNSAPLAPNSSCATSQGSRSSGAHTRDGAATDASAVADVVADNASRPGSFASRRAAKYSGFSALQRACVRLRRSRWHASAEQTRCRSPWRALGKYHRQHIRHGRFRFTTPSLPPPPSRVASDPQLVNRAPGKTGSILASRPGSILASAEAPSASSSSVSVTRRILKAMRISFRRYADQPGVTAPSAPKYWRFGLGKMDARYSACPSES